ncbi:MAG: ABC transporter ATP-binding protein [Ruminococcus sp.]|nr:ABC transporter ATP-binding protein [Ruminococcus sp.]
MAIIEVRDVKKSFRVYFDKGHTMKEKLLFGSRRRYDERVVLDGISFDIEKGEAVGLVGHNGCGKSTLLKLLTKIIYPDSGTVKTYGRVSSLLELGAGFHPDMTGRENIYTNASIFGLTKKEIESRIDDIIEFSELEEFIDNPVRTYSSGMYTRLAFSVAINVDADILLVDEILAVGDAAFQAKCLEKMLDIKSRGTTIAIVSHSLSQVEQICGRTIWIDGGKIRMDGSPNEVHPQYLEYMGLKRRSPKQAPENKDIKRENPENKEFFAEITKAEIIGEDGTASCRYRTGERVTLKIHYKADPSKLDGVLIGLAFYRSDKLNCYGTNTIRERIDYIKLKEQGEITCEIDRLNFVRGSYWLDIAIRSRDMFAYDYKAKAVEFTVYSTVDEVGVARLDHRWIFD